MIQLSEHLYQLLPGIYKSYDAIQGESLRALLALLEQELQVVETDLDRLYEAWFIETCDDWVVPYISDLVDAQTLYSRSLRQGQERRAFVANTIGYRRRKGTATVLEQLAIDISGWHGRAVESLNLLAHSSELSILVGTLSSTVDLRQAQQLEQVGSPFGSGAFTAEVRDGRYQLGSIGLFLWRLQSYPLLRVTARPVQSSPEQWRGHCFTFDPLGYDLPLFNQPQTKAIATEPTIALHVPDPLKRSALFNEIQQRRAAKNDVNGYFGATPVLQIFVDGQADSLSPEQILITDLTNWEVPTWVSYNDRSLLCYEVAVDPELGRFVLLNRPLPKRVEVSYSYGFSGDVGGGSYNRSKPETASNPVVWQVKQEPKALQSAIEQWHQTTETWEACRTQAYIPLAKLQVPTLPWVDLEHTVRQRFSPGIVTGLEVLAAPGAGAVIVNRGKAIDIQGRVIELNQPFTVLLDLYKDQTILLVAIYSQAGAHIEVIPATLATRHSDRIYIRLALIAVNINGQLISQSTAQRVQFQPGIVSGLEIKLNQNLDGIVIQPGLAVNRKGQRIELSTRHTITFNPDREQSMLLLLSRRTELGRLDREERRGQQWQLDWIVETAADQYSSDQFLRLVRLPASPKKSTVIEISDEHLRSTFKSGIVWGLSVVAYPGQNRAIVTPGVAVGLQGKTISVPVNQRIPLRGYPNKTITIYLIYQVSPELNWSIVASETSLGTSAIALATLTLDHQGRLCDLPNLSLRKQFKPGILPGELSVTPHINTTYPQVTIATGTAIDAQGRSLLLSSPQTFDLRSYRDQTVLVFLAYEARQGWKLGAVVEEAEVGRIEIQDSATYITQNLQIKVPSGKQLEIVAANSYRPHLQGNLTVQGSAGEITLEGLLIEGPIRILPGELKHFSLNHCTVVPGLGGFVVQSLPKPVIDSEAAEWSMIAFTMYYVHLIWELTAINLNSKLTSSQILTQLIQIGTQRLRHLIMDCWRSCRSTQADDILATYLTETSDNEQLQIDIAYSICGAIQVNSAIAQINIRDSIIDTGTKSAIEVLRSHLTCNNTTVLGSTTVLSLEATNTLFTEHIAVWRQQVGSLRFCYVPDESQTPRRYRCQPDQVFDRLDRLPAEVTALISDRETVFAATVTGQVWRFSEAEAAWQLFQKGMFNLPIQTLAVDSLNHRIYAGTTEGYIFSISNNRDRWEPLTQLRSDVITRNVSVNTPTVNQILLKDGQIFAATLGGRVFHSSDWTASSQGLEQAIWTINTIALHPKTGWIFAGTAGTGIYYSKDNAQSWQKALSINLTNQMITALAIDRQGQIFAGTAGAFTKDSGIFYSTNNGDSWTFVQFSIAQRNITAIVIHPLNDAVFVGTANGGLLRSQDSGRTWTTLSQLSHRHITAITITEQGKIFVGTAGGMIWTSENNGDYWTPNNTGFNNAEAKLLLLNQLQPNFTSTQYGNPGYAQLSLTCANEICTGGEDSAEIGCFNSLKQPQRKANLQTSLLEYLRFGLEVTPFYIT